jgi:hypothetical protein
MLQFNADGSVVSGLKEIHDIVHSPCKSAQGGDAYFALAMD